MKINTNIVSMVTQNYLRKSNQGLETSMERLSSGKRINSAADDAAGLAIAERMQSKVRGQEVGIRNSNDGISLVQTAESALGSVSNILQRMRELSIQSVNGTYSSDDRLSLDKEYQLLVAEIDHIAAGTTFNSVNLLSSNTATIGIQLSDAQNDTMSITTIDARATALGITGDVLTPATSDTAIGNLDTAITNVSNMRAQFGAYLNRLNFNVDNITSMKNNLTAAKSRIEDADMAKEVSEMTKNKILTQSGVAMLTQANQNPQMITQLLQG